MKSQKLKKRYPLYGIRLQGTLDERVHEVARATDHKASAVIRLCLQKYLALWEKELGLVKTRQT